MAENQVNIAIIKGKVEEVHQYEGRFYHRTTLPAPDEYSRPQACMVIAASRLADPGNEIHVKASIRGWTRRFDRKDGGVGHEVNTNFEVIQ